MTVTTIQLLLCVALAGVAGAIVGRAMTHPLLPQFDHDNGLRKAINNALIRGHQSDLIAGWRQRHDYCAERVGQEIDTLTHNMMMLDAQAMVELIGRGYEGSHRHMHTLGWLAHSIGFDVRKYEGAKA